MGLVDSQIVNSAPLVPIARSKDDHLDRKVLAYGARALLPRPILQSPGITGPKVAETSRTRQVTDWCAELRKRTIGKDRFENLFQVSASDVVSSQAFKRSSLEIHKFFVLDNTSFYEVQQFPVLKGLRNPDGGVIRQAAIAIRQVVVGLIVLKRPKQWRRGIEAGDAKRGEARDVICLGKSQDVNLRLVWDRIADGS